MVFGNEYPVSGGDPARFAGMVTFLRLPHVTVDVRSAQVGIGSVLGVWDCNATSRPGPKHALRPLCGSFTSIDLQDVFQPVDPAGRAACPGAAALVERFYVYSEGKARRLAA